MRTQIINDLMTNIFFNLIETEDRIAADERFEGLSSNDALEIYKVLSDQHPYLCRTYRKRDQQQNRNVHTVVREFPLIEDLSVSPERLLID